MGMADDIMVIQFEERLRRRAAAEAADRDDMHLQHPSAFDAAYDSLAAGGIVKHAQIRDEITRRILVELIALRTHHGMTYMEYIAARPSLRAPIVQRVWSGDNEQSSVAIDEAMVAAALVLAEG
jgi:hypothetical protein